MNSNQILENLIRRYPNLTVVSRDVEAALHILVESLSTGGKVLICGNGGSAADAEHIVGELMKSFVVRRPLHDKLKKSLIDTSKELGLKLADSLQGTIPAVSLVHSVALNSAFSNDVDPQMVFAQQVLGYGSPTDILWGISTSGNAVNVTYAAITAKAKGMKVIGMTGTDGGMLKQYCDVCIKVPENETYLVQELHLPIYHAICMMLEHAFWP